MTRPFPRTPPQAFKFCCRWAVLASVTTSHDSGISGAKRQRDDLPSRLLVLVLTLPIVTCPARRDPRPPRVARAIDSVEIWHYTHRRQALLNLRIPGEYANRHQTTSQ